MQNLLANQVFCVFPRLRPAEGTVAPNFIMDDTDLTQLICAYRLWNEDLEISLSTREKKNSVIILFL
jgi:2-iminoacetate synthase